MKRFLVLATLIGFIVLGPRLPVASASIGVGTGVRSIEVTQPFVAGGTYRIHPFTIVNTGSEASGFGILVSPSTHAGMRVPPSWLSFQPQTFYLYPKQGLDVEPSLQISLDATPGLYQIRLLGVPKMASDLTPGGHVNIGVGPRLTFSVVQPNPWQRVYFLYLGWMPWSGLLSVALCAIVVFAAGIVFWRRRARASGHGPYGLSPSVGPPADAA